MDPNLKQFLERANDPTSCPAFTKINNSNNDWSAIKVGDLKTVKELQDVIREYGGHPIRFQQPSYAASSQLNAPDNEDHVTALQFQLSFLAIGKEALREIRMLKEELANVTTQRNHARDEAANARNDAANARNEAANARNEAANARNEAANARNDAANARNEAANARSEAANVQASFDDYKLNWKVALEVVGVPDAQALDNGLNPPVAPN